MKKILIALIFLSLFLLVGSWLWKGSEPDKKQLFVQQVEVGLTQGKMAPDFTLKNIDGKEVKLSDYRGKTVILNFFGVWCGWCTKEMPGFMKVYNEFKDKNLELVVVDTGDDLNTVVNYFKSNKFDIKPLMDSEDKVARKYRIQGFPTTFILDKDGIIRTVHSGYMDEKMLKSILENVVK